MEKKARSLIRRSPRLYSFLKRGLYAFRHIQRRLLGTRMEEKYWATAHLRKNSDWSGENRDWARDYWDSWNHSHRSFLIEKILNFSPSSVLEIGSNCGPNLYLLAKRLPDAEIRGIDINSEAVAKGNQWFTEEHISNVKLSVGKADDLRQFGDKSIDVVFTDAVLIYIGPDRIRKVTKEMLRVVRRALILLEYNDFDLDSNRIGLFEGHWRRNYAALLEEFVPKKGITVTKLPKELWNDERWQKWGAIIEADLQLDGKNDLTNVQGQHAGRRNLQ